MKWVYAACLVGMIITASMVAIMAYSAMPSEVPDREVATARALMQGLEDAPAPFNRPDSFTAEIDLILSVQDAVLSVAPRNEGIPLGQTRGLVELVQAGKGLCYDRSRAIENILSLYNLEIRHAAVYSTQKTGSAIKSLITPGISSHAVSEVKTKKGWLVIDSNARWIGLTDQGVPVDLEALRENPDLQWHSRVPGSVSPIFRKSYTWVYGLYSRHGEFYPPFNPVPDVKWSEVGYNFGI